MRMRDIINILSEYATISLPVGEEKAFIQVNPPLNDLLRILNKSPYGELRGYYHDGKVYFWESEDLFHNYFTVDMNFPHVAENCFYLNYEFGSNNKVVLVRSVSSDDDNAFSQEVLNDPYIQKLFTPNDKKSVLVLNTKTSIQEFKYEKIQSGPHEVVVAINPTKDEISSMLNKSRNGIIRGYYDDGNFYFWDAFFAIHGTAAKELGLEYNYLNRLTLIKKEFGYVLDYDEEMLPVYTNNYYFNNTFEIDYTWDGMTFLREKIEKDIIQNQKGYYVHKRREELGIENNVMVPEDFKRRLKENYAKLREAFVDKDLNKFFLEYSDNFLDNYNIRQNKKYICYKIYLTQDDLENMSISSLKTVVYYVNLKKEEYLGDELMEYKKQQNLLYRPGVRFNNPFIMVFDSVADRESFSSHLGLSSDLFSKSNSKYIVKELGNQKECTMRDFIMFAEAQIFESLNETAIYNVLIAKFLNKEGIEFQEYSNTIYIDRTSMVRYAKGFNENEAYDYVLELIREQLPDTLYVSWAGRTDDWLGISVYERNFSK